MQEHTQRNHTNVVNVASPFFRNVTFLYIQKYTLERNPTNAVSVTWPSQGKVNLLYTQEYTLEKTPPVQ